ncbi:SspB family protein [Pseudochelatococcus sp. B33]
MAKDFIRYDLHVQDALRGVVRRVLADVVRDGLPGEHHFYITFRTQHPGVRLSNRMRAEYPDEMTIVLQHQFWDLAVTEHAFEVGLSFKGIPEKLVVPFEAMTGFFDRSVDFGLRFESDVEIDEEDDSDEAYETDDTPQATGQVTQGAFPRRIFEITPETEDRTGAPPAENADPPVSGDSTADDSAPSDADIPLPAGGDEPPASPDDDAAPVTGEDGGSEEKGAGARVVQLDAFRKKNT